MHLKECGLIDVEIDTGLIYISKQDISQIIYSVFLLCETTILTTSSACHIYQSNQILFVFC